MIDDVSTLGELIDRAAQRWPQREALVHGVGRITYAELCRRAMALAAALLRLGVRRGDKVAVLFANVPEWAYAEYAVVKIGAVVVPISTRYSRDEIHHVLRHSDSTTILLMERHHQSDFLATLCGICPELPACPPGELRSAAAPRLRNVVVSGEGRHPGTFDFGELLQAPAPGDEELVAAAQAEVRPDDVAHLPYTSGTTGLPKGVMTTHAQYLRFNQGFIRGIGGFSPEDRLCVAAPFCHNFGNSQGILTPALCGSTSVLVESFAPEACLALLERERCTFFAGSPTIFIKMLADPSLSSRDLSSLRSGLIAAAPAPVAVIEEIRSRLGIRTLVNGYGMTENSVGTTMTRPGDPPEILATTVGKVLWPEYELRVVDPATGQALPPGQAGELCTRGPLIMKGSYKMPEATAAALDAEGWFHTGDLATLDEQGYVRISGRLKDIFMPGGLNVSPEEVENVLYAQPAVKEAAVVGVPDPVLGEVGAAFVELKEGETATEAELVAACRERLASYKVPKYVIFSRDFPTTSSGKHKKYLLKEEAIRRLGLENRSAP
ncbi:MAG: AMP-binding protein [Deltaproteobacteria bacterium]|nr:AMP-binding protein [Deltaproteobacteria bacterium]